MHNNFLYMGITVGPVQGTRFPGVGGRRSWGQLGKPLAGSVVLTWRPAIFLAGKMVRDRSLRRAVYPCHRGGYAHSFSIWHGHRRGADMSLPRMLRRPLCMMLSLAGLRERERERWEANGVEDEPSICNGAEAFSCGESALIGVYVS